VGNDQICRRSSRPDDGNTLSALVRIAASISVSRRGFDLRGSCNSIVAPRWERPARIEGDREVADAVLLREPSAVRFEIGLDGGD
jgi:hypothetical protein